VLIFSGGVHGRFTPHAEEIASYIDRTDLQHELTRSGTCFLEPGFTYSDYKPDVCLHRDPAKTKNYLLMGDSHSAVLWNALSETLPDANILQASATPCRPFIHPPGSEPCQQLMNFIFQKYIPSQPVQALFLEGRWREPDLPGIAETINWAKARGLPVILFGNVPEYDEALPRLLAYSLAWNKPGLLTAHRSAYSAPLDAKLQQLAADTWHVPYVSLYQAVCSQGRCNVYADNAQQVPILADDDHFSRLGALTTIRKVNAEGELHFDATHETASAAR
jgi:hypothetical protein